MKRYFFVISILLAGLLMASCGSNSGKNESKPSTPVGDLALYNLNPRYPVESVQSFWNGSANGTTYFDDKNRAIRDDPKDSYSHYHTSESVYSSSDAFSPYHDNSLYPITSRSYTYGLDDGFSFSYTYYYDRWGRLVLIASDDYYGDVYYTYNENNQIDVTYNWQERTVYTYDSNGLLIQTSYYSPKSDDGTFEGPNDPAKLNGFTTYKIEEVDAKGNWTKRSGVSEHNLGETWSSSNSFTETRIIRYKESNLPLSPALR